MWFKKQAKQVTSMFSVFLCGLKHTTALHKLTLCSYVAKIHSQSIYVLYIPMWFKKQVNQ
jgi:hypothetical protein